MRSEMRVVLVTCVMLSVTHAYYVRYLNVTAATLLTNRRLLQCYVRCFVDEGPCPPQAREIKSKFVLVYVFLLV
nr:chemosensory protein [Matsumurasca onukii]